MDDINCADTQGSERDSQLMFTGMIDITAETPQPSGIAAPDVSRFLDTSSIIVK
jgi:hypothetical protein